MNRRSGLVAFSAVALAFALILVLLATGCQGTPATSSAPEKATQVSAQSPGSSTTASSTNLDQALADSIESQFKKDLGATSFTLTQAAFSRDANGNWQLLTKLQVPSVEVANASIQEVMGWIEAKVAALNRDSQVRLAGLHVYVQTPSGQMVVDWTEDLAGGTATGNWAGGITNYWFPSPPPAQPTTTTSFVSTEQTMDLSHIKTISETAAISIAKDYIDQVAREHTTTAPPDVSATDRWVPTEVEVTHAFLGKPTSLYGPPGFDGPVWTLKMTTNKTTLTVVVVIDAITGKVVGGLIW
jgi:hypothetical protein